LKPNSKEAHNNVGNCYLKKGKINKARKHFLQSLKIDPDYPAANYNLGYLLDKEGNFNDAIHYYKAAVNVYPDYLKARLALTKALVLSGKIIEANQHVDSLLQVKDLFSEKKNIQTMVHLSEILTEQGEIEKAIFILMKIVEANPQLNSIYYNIACLYSRQNNVKKAIKWLNLAIDKGYKNWDHIRTDSDLDPIRHTTSFQQIVREVSNIEDINQTMKGKSKNIKRCNYSERFKASA